MKLRPAVLFSLLVLSPSWALGWSWGDWNDFTIVVKEDGRLGRTFKADARYCRAHMPVRWDFGDGTVVHAKVGHAVSHRYPIGGTYEARAISLCGADSEEVKVADLFLPQELKTALERTLDLISAPDVPGDRLAKGQFDELRLWDYLFELIEASGESLPVLSPEIELWLLKTDAKLQLSRYLGAPVDLIEIPKEDAIRGMSQLFLLRYWELAFEAALGIEADEVQLSDADGSLEPPSVPLDILIAVALENGLDPEDQSLVQHMTNVFRFWYYLGGGGCIKEQYTLNEATAALLKGLVIVLDKAAHFQSAPEYRIVMRDATTVNTIYELRVWVERAIRNTELTAEAKFRKILETVYFLSDEEIAQYESLQPDCNPSDDYICKLRNATEERVTSVLYEIGKRRADELECQVLEKASAPVDLEGLEALFANNDLDALFLINRLSMGSFAVGMLTFTHINATLDSSEFEGYLLMQPGEGELETIRKAVLAFTIMYYRYYRAIR